jgi:hypothetical protein
VASVLSSWLWGARFAFVIVQTVCNVVRKTEQFLYLTGQRALNYEPNYSITIDHIQILTKSNQRMMVVHFLGTKYEPLG